MSEKERTSTLSKVAGGTPEDQVIVEQHFSRQHDQSLVSQQHEQSLVWKAEDHPEVLVEKTQEQVRIFEQLNVLVGDFVRAYGGTPMDFNLDRLILFDSSKLPEDIQKKFVPGFGGGFSFIEERIIIPLDRRSSSLQLARTTVHEFLHAQAFHSVRIVRTNPESISITDRREGLAMWSRDDRSLLLHKINEAVTQELTERFDAEYFARIPELTDKLKDRQELREKLGNPEGEPIAHSWQNEDGSWSAEIFVRSTYKKEREYLKELLGRIQQAHSDRFADQEAVFAFFARAYFSGRLLELARLVESTIGPGAFRRIATETQVEK